MKIVLKIRFGIWTKDKNIIYSCEIEGYGPGNIQFFDFSNNNEIDLYTGFYEKDSDSSVTSCLFNEKEKQFNFSIKNNFGEKQYTYSITDNKLNENQENLYDSKQIIHSYINYVKDYIKMDDNDLDKYYIKVDKFDGFFMMRMFSNLNKII